MPFNIPFRFQQVLPRSIDKDNYDLITYGFLCNTHTINTADNDNIPDSAPVVILPGWSADSVNYLDQERYYPDTKTSEEAAQKHAQNNDYGPILETTWVDVYVWRSAYVLTNEKTEEIRQITFDSCTHSAIIYPEAPDCVEGKEHDWQTPIELVGGPPENPGVKTYSK